MHLGLDCRSACAPPSRPPPPRAGARKQVQATLQAAPQAPLQVQVFLTGLDEESGMWQRSNPATAPAPNGTEPRKVNGVHHPTSALAVPVQQSSCGSAAPMQQSSCGSATSMPQSSSSFTVVCDAPVQPVPELQPVAGTDQPINATVSCGNGTSSSHRPTLLADVSVPQDATTTVEGAAAAAAAATATSTEAAAAQVVQASPQAVAAAQPAAAVARKRRWQKAANKQLPGSKPASPQACNAAAASNSLADVLQQLDSLMQQHRSRSVGSQGAESATATHSKSKQAKQPPATAAARSQEVTKAGSRVQIARTTTRQQGQPNGPHAGQISALPDLASLCASWCKYHDVLQPQHTTGMWLRLNQLVHAGLQKPQAGDAAATQLSAGGLVQSNHSHPPSTLPVASTTDQQQEQPQHSNAGQYKEQLTQQFTQLQKLFRSEVVKVWNGLQQQSRLQVHVTTVNQVADQLYAHTELQLLANKQLQLAQQLHQLHVAQQQRQQQQQQRAMPQHDAAEAADPAVTQAVKDDQQGQLNIGNQHEDYKQPKQLRADPAAATSTSSSPLVDKGLRKRARSRLITLQLRHTKFVRDQLQLTALHLHGAKPATLAVLLACCSRLDQMPPQQWIDAWWAASLPKLKDCTCEQLSSICRSVGHLGLQPSADWCQALYEATQPLLRKAELELLCAIVHGAAMLKSPPPASWSNLLLKICNDRFDELDAPAYALLLHGLGRMRLRPNTGWVQEYWDSTMSLMDDFTVQELSLMLRGAAYLGCVPEPHWQQELWQHSQRLLKASTVEQLVGLGWAVLVGLSLRPPRAWVTTWVAALNRKVRAAGIQGGARLPRGTAHRAAAALQVIGVRDLASWCARLRAPVPQRAFASTAQQPAIGRSSGAAAWGAAGSMAGPTASDDWDGAQWQQGGSQHMDFNGGEEDGSAMSPMQFSYGAPRPRLFSETSTAPPPDVSYSYSAPRPRLFPETSLSDVSYRDMPPQSSADPNPPPLPTPLPASSSGMRQLAPSWVPAPASDVREQQCSVVSDAVPASGSPAVSFNAPGISYDDEGSSDEGELDLYNRQALSVQVVM